MQHTHAETETCDKDKKSPDAQERSPPQTPRAV